jgi:PTH1 family peptidyl-tRNA hydrolase
VDPIVIVGLGNPGFEYEETRHNVGFRVVDVLCGRFKKRLKPGKGEYLFSTLEIDSRQVALVKPLAMMNNSGLAVVEFLDEIKGSQQHLVVIVDDFALPLGTIRVRAKGSDGGHNGLYSIIYHLQSNAFARIRCGIKQEVMPPKSEMAGFVLSSFDRRERTIVDRMVGQAADAAVEIVRSGISRAMNKFST